MPNKKQKLELTWIGKDEQPVLEPRILIEDPDKSYGDKNTENMLIYGDNLLALKALEQDYEGRIKCIYIDPPFNTGQAFEYYDDTLEHSIWLQLIYQRILLLYKLLNKEGLFWIHLDDSEVHYCKIILDQVFGRNSFISHITYERSGVAGLGQGGFLVNTTEHILLYKKDSIPQNSIKGTSELDLGTMKRYNKRLIEKGNKELIREFISKSNGCPVKVYKHKEFKIETISLKNFKNNEKVIRTLYKENLNVLFRGNRIQKENAFQQDLLGQMHKENLYSVEYTPSRGKYENKLITLYYYNKELLSWLGDNTEIVDDKIIKKQKLTTLWTHSEIPKADIANEGGIKFPRGKKPEQLLKRIIEISTNKGDWVLDSFLGSGTTASVAHKLERKWIGIELGEHCETHSIPRLINVCKGKDQTGISKLLKWKGGGGFKYYYLAPSLLNQDEHGNWVISKEYIPQMLAAAMAKNEGFIYNPDDLVYWKQGKSTEKDYIFTTTGFITIEHLDKIHEQMLEDESLLICCKSFSKESESRYANITIKKIPQLLLGQCEFGKEDYSLNIINVPMLYENEYLTEEDCGENHEENSQDGLFGGNEDE